MMFIGKTIPFVTTCVDEGDRALRQKAAEAGLPRIQKEWLGFCLVAIFVTNSVCWKRAERASLGTRSARSVSWMFRQTTRFWEFVLHASVTVIVAKYGLTAGGLVGDDSEKTRAKQTKRIYKAHQVKDNKSGGCINGQQVVLLLLVTRTIPIPVGVECSMPAPQLTAWKKEEKRVNARGVPKKNRPATPKPPPTIPPFQRLLSRCCRCFTRCVLADNLYGTQAFLGQTSAI